MANRQNFCRNGNDEFACWYTLRLCDGSTPPGCIEQRQAAPFLLLRSLLLAIMLLLLSAFPSLAVPVSSQWIDGTGNWNTAGSWNPSGVPDNGIDTFRVTITGGSSVVTLNNLDPAVDDLTLNSSARLLITGRSLEFQDNSGGLLSNNGTIELKGASLDPASNLRIYGEVRYLGNNGIILYDDNINHGFQGTTVESQKLIIDPSATMLLQGAVTGGQGILGQEGLQPPYTDNTRLRLQNYGKLDIRNFTEFKMHAPSTTPWINEGDIIVAKGSNVSFTGKLDQVSSDGGLVQVNGVLNLVNGAHISEGMITGTGEVIAASATLENVQLRDIDLTCTGTLTLKKNIDFATIKFRPGTRMYISDDTTVLQDAEWYFPTDGSQASIRGLIGGRLTIRKDHSFFGKVSMSDLILDIPKNSQVIINNNASFSLNGGSLIAGTIATKEGGSAVIGNANVTGFVIAVHGSAITLGGDTEIKGEAITMGTGRIIGTENAMLNGAVVNGHIYLAPQLSMGGHISGDFSVHFNAGGAGRHYLWIATKDARLLAGTKLNLSFDSEGNNILLADALKGPLIVTSGATLKMSGKKGAVYGPITNNGNIEADGMTSGTLSYLDGIVTNASVIRLKNNSTLTMSHISNASGTIIVDSTSKAELASGPISEGTLQGPVAEEQLRGMVMLNDVANQNGAFVGRGASLENVTNAATIVVPSDGSLGITDALNNRGQLIVEGNVNLLSQVTTLNGGGEVILNGGTIKAITGPASGANLVNKDNTIRGKGMITFDFARLPITNRGFISADQDVMLDLNSHLKNHGTIEAVGPGGLAIKQLDNDGTVRVASGSFLSVGSIENRGMVSAASGSRLEVHTIFQKSGNFTVNGELTYGTMGVQRIDVTGGTFSGGSVLQNLAVTGGTLHIANGTGTLEVKGTYSQGPNGVLEVELGGHNQGVNYDLLKTNTGGSQFATTNLDGTVRVKSVSGFEPKPGDQFTFLSAFGIGGISGRFANVVNATPYAVDFELVYDVATVTLRVLAPGALRVNITPNTAQWRRTAADTWRNSGATENSIAPGSHQVEFSILAGYNTQLNQSVIIESGKTRTLNVTYTANTSTYAINAAVSGSGGRVTGADTYQHNALVRLEAIADKGFRFVHWQNAQGKLVSAGARLEFRATTGLILTAHFRRAGLSGILMLLLE